MRRTWSTSRCALRYWTWHAPHWHSYTCPRAHSLPLSRESGLGLGLGLGAGTGIATGLAELACALGLLRGASDSVGPLGPEKAARADSASCPRAFA